MLLWCFLCLLIDVFSASAQYIQAGIDTVYQFHPGSGQNLGQSPEFFPQNIFGLPDTAARWNVPSADPRQICSLGMDGMIIIGWKQLVLVDGPGPDFTVFENAFAYGNGKIFAEPAIVSVSKDGVHFVTFPFDSLSLEGCAGKTPTNGAADPFNPQLSGGDAFDLSAIGIDTVRFIRIQDISRMVKENPHHPYWDPTISGFDLDAVVGLHLAPATTSSRSLSITLQDRSVTVWGTQTPIHIAVYSLHGRRLMVQQVQRLPTTITLPAPGTYALVASQSDKIERWIVVTTPYGSGWSR